MGLLIGLIVGLLFSVPACMVVRILTKQESDQLHAIELQKLKEEHRKEFEGLIAKINHEGPIKDGVSAVGLMNLILWAIKNSIKSLEELYAKQDWNTKEVTTDLQQIVMVELRLLYSKVSDWIESVRNHLKDYNHKQE